MDRPTGELWSQISLSDLVYLFYRSSILPAERHRLLVCNVSLAVIIQLYYSCCISWKLSLINRIDVRLCVAMYLMRRMLWNRAVCWSAPSAAADPHAFVATSQCLPAEALAGTVETRVWAERDADDSSIPGPHLCSSSAYSSWGRFHFII